MFTKIGCDRSAITDMLGGQTGVTDANLMQANKQWVHGTNSTFSTTLIFIVPWNY